MARKRKKKDTSGSKEYRPRTMNITPFLLRVASLFLIAYLLYCATFLYAWGIVPYIFDYTVYVVEVDYEEYGIDKGDLIFLKREEDVPEDTIVVERVGTEYKVTKGVRRPYGVVVCKDVVEEVRSWLKILNSDEW